MKREHLSRMLWNSFQSNWQLLLTILSCLAIGIYLLLSALMMTFANLPLLCLMIMGGIPVFLQIFLKILKGNWGADTLAAIALVTGVILQEYLAASLIILMLASGQTLERYARQKASSVLFALANRMPSVAHRRVNGTIEDIPVIDIHLQDEIVIYPHESSPDLAELMPFTEIHASQSPEQKLAIVTAERKKAPTVFMGDGINDAPALTAATVGIAFGQHSNVTAEAAGAVIMENTLSKVDVLLHLSIMTRRIAAQSAIGGMVLSLVGMGFAAIGLISPVMGAILQECIDILAIVNALRLALGSAIQIDLPVNTPEGASI